MNIKKILSSVVSLAVILGCAANYPIYGKVLAGEFPESYDMREHKAVSSVKQQSGYGTCWAHSAIASAESSIINYDPAADLSEFHLAYYSQYNIDDVQELPLAQRFNLGGTPSRVINTWANWWGPVSESTAPYGNTAVFEDSSRVEEMKDECIYHLENAIMFDYNSDKSNMEEVNSRVKRLVTEGRAVNAAIYSNLSQCYSSLYHSSNTNKKPRYENHTVTIIGWDDNFPAEKFEIPAEHDGAWLVKNSYGAGFGDSGYMWLSYFDRSLGEFAVFELGDKDNYSVNLHYDNFVPLQSLSAGNTEENAPSYMATVFETDEDLQLEAVSTYIRGDNTDYEITVYTDLKDPKDPSSGTPSAVTKGVSEYSGYMTLPLDRSVTLEKNEPFAISVKLYNNDINYVIPVESCIYVVDDETGEIFDLNSYVSYNGLNGTVQEGRNFISENGLEWVDLAFEDNKYSEEEEQELLEEIHNELFEDIEPDDTEMLALMEKQYEKYKEKFEKGTVYFKIGNTALKAFASPVGNVSFSHISGQIPLDENVELKAPDGNDIYYKINDGEVKKYTEPIAIDRKMNIKASTNGEYFAERNFTPARASLNALGYVQSLTTTEAMLQYISLADNSRIIRVNSDTSEIKLYPVSHAEILINGEKVDSASFSDKISLTDGNAEVTVKLSEEDRLDNEITFYVTKERYAFDLSEEKVYLSGISDVKAPDGTVIKNGDDISAYAGQELTGTAANGEEYSFTVPEKNIMKELPEYTKEGRIISVPENYEVGRYEYGEIVWGGNTFGYGEDVLIRIGAGENTLPSEAVAVKIYEMGDVDGNGFVDAADASEVLAHYVNLSTGKKGSLQADKLPFADMDGDSFVTAADASSILSEYIHKSTAVA